MAATVALGVRTDRGRLVSKSRGAPSAPSCAPHLERSGSRAVQKGAQCGLGRPIKVIPGHGVSLAWISPGHAVCASIQARKSAEPPATGKITIAGLDRGAADASRPPPVGQRRARLHHHGHFLLPLEPALPYIDRGEAGQDVGAGGKPCGDQRLPPPSRLPPRSETWHRRVLPARMAGWQLAGRRTPSCRSSCR